MLKKEPRQKIGRHSEAFGTAVPGLMKEVVVVL